MIVAGTGHRPDKLDIHYRMPGGGDMQLHHWLMDMAMQYLDEVGAETVISGMALGWDLALANAALYSNIPYVAAVPFKGQERKWPQWHQDLYNGLLVSASHVEVVCKGDYDPAKMVMRNRWMVNRADRMCALWDGSSGGTSNCVRYARKAGKPIDNLWTRWEQRIFDLDLLI